MFTAAKFGTDLFLGMVYALWKLAFICYVLISLCLDHAEDQREKRKINLRYKLYQKTLFRYQGDRFSVLHGFSTPIWRQLSPDQLSWLIDWEAVDHQLAMISNAAKGQPDWPPRALFKAFLLQVLCDLSDVTLAEELDDRASFRRFCDFSDSNPTPERKALVQFRKTLAAQGLDKPLLGDVTNQIKAGLDLITTEKAIDATTITFSGKDDVEAKRHKYKEIAVDRGNNGHAPMICGTMVVE